MSIALNEDHKFLASTAADFLAKHGARSASRALLEAPTEELPTFWRDLAELGWLGLHIAEANGGSGYGLEELVVVVEQLGRAGAPGPFVPTVIASATIASRADAATQAALLPGLADGTRTGAAALEGSVQIRDGRAYGSTGVVLGGSLADVLLVGNGDDVAIIDTHADGVSVDTPPNLDPTRRSSRITLDGVPAIVMTGARQTLTDIARVILSAEAVGVARECTEQAAAYAKVRLQFGRPIAMYQAEAPLRQHGRRHRTGYRHGVGRGTGVEGRQ